MRKPSPWGQSKEELYCPIHKVIARYDGYEGKWWCPEGHWVNPPLMTRQEAMAETADSGVNSPTFPADGHIRELQEANERLVRLLSDLLLRLRPEDKRKHPTTTALLLEAREKADMVTGHLNNARVALRRAE